MIVRNNKRKLFSSALSFEEITSLSHEIAKKVISGELTKEEAIVEVMDKANWSYGYADAAVSSWIENEPTYNGMVMSSFTLHYKNDDGEDSVWGIYGTKEEAESEIEKFRTTGFGPNPAFCEIIESSRKAIKSAVTVEKIQNLLQKNGFSFIGGSEDKAIFRKGTSQIEFRFDPQLDYFVQEIEGYKNHKKIFTDEFYYDSSLKDVKLTVKDCIEQLNSSYKPIKSSFAIKIIDRHGEEDSYSWVNGDRYNASKPEIFDTREEAQSVAKEFNKFFHDEGLGSFYWTSVVEYDDAINSSRKAIKSDFEIYKGAKFKNQNGATIEIVRKDDDGYVLFKTYDGKIRDSNEDSVKNMLRFNKYTPINSSRKAIKSSRSWKANSMIKEMYDQHYITEEGYNTALLKPYTDEEINTLERYFTEYRNPSTDWDDIRNIIKDTVKIITSSRKAIK